MGAFDLRDKSVLRTTTILRQRGQRRRRVAGTGIVDLRRFANVGFFSNGSRGLEIADSDVNSALSPTRVSGFGGANHSNHKKVHRPHLGHFRGADPPLRSRRRQHQRYDAVQRIQRIPGDPESASLEFETFRQLGQHWDSSTRPETAHGSGSMRIAT